MPIPRRYRRLLVVVAIALMLVAVTDEASSQKVSGYAKAVVSDLLGEVAELMTPTSERAPAATATNRPPKDVASVGFPAVAESPAAFGSFALVDQPRTSLADSLVTDLEATSAPGRQFPTAAASFPRPGSGPRSVAGKGGSHFGSTSAGGGVPPPTPTEGTAPGSQVEIAASASEPGGADASNTATSAADSAAALSANPLVASLLAELASGAASVAPGDADEELSAGLNQDGVSDLGAFGDGRYDPVSSGDLLAPGPLTVVAARGSATGEPGLATPAVVHFELGLEWPHLLDRDAALELSGSVPADEHSSPAAPVVVLSEPAMLAAFGAGLIAVAGRLRRARRS